MPRTKIKKPIALGNQVRDIVTGYTGIACSKVEYLNGCIQFGVKGSVSEPGKMPDAHYIDIEQLEYAGNIKLFLIGIRWIKWK